MTAATAKELDLVANAAAALRFEMIDFCLEVGNLPDYCGEEIAVAHALCNAYRECGLSARLQHLSPSSANVIAQWRGSAPGREGAHRVLFNSHLDTEGAEPEDASMALRLRGTWLEGDELLVGKGLINAKVHLVAQLFAVRVLKDAHLSLDGDLLLTASAQETGMSATGGGDPWSGPHSQEGRGARFMVDHGVSADFVIVGEPTGFAICSAQAGYCRFRIELDGTTPYTPFVARNDDATSDNPFERAPRIIDALSLWSRDYEQRSVHFDGGTVAPKAQILSIASGTATFTELADRCVIYFDVRTTPTTSVEALRRELCKLLGDIDPTCRIECYDFRRGYVAAGAELVIAAVEHAHRAVFKEAPKAPHPAQTSMWQDTNAFNEVGIPAISYGIAPVPETFTREHFRALRVDDLVALAQVYALCALNLCRA